MASSHRTPRKSRYRKRKHVWQPSQKHAMTTRLGRKVSVCNASIRTTELLENILLHLDTKDLQRARQVCKFWNAIVSTSPVIQRCLFARPEANSLTWVLDPLTNALAPWSLNNDETLVDKAWFSRQGACVPAVLNTNFLTRDPDSVSGLIDIRQRFDRAESLRFNANLKSFTPSFAMANSFLTQPPAKEIVVYVAHRNSQPRKPWTPRAKNESRFEIFVEEGVKWSDLLNVMRDELGKDKYGQRAGRKVWVDMELSRVWVIGSVFYNGAEYEAIMSGKEAEGVSPSYFMAHSKRADSAGMTSSSTAGLIINTNADTGLGTSPHGRKMSQGLMI